MPGHDTSGTDPRLQLVPVSGRNRLWLFLLTAVLPLLLIVLLPLLTDAGDVAKSQWPGLLHTPLLVVIVAIPLWFVLDRLMQRHRLHVDAGGIEVVSSLYRDRLPLDELQLGDARVIDLDEHPGRKPLLRSNGMSVPGFHSGWFRSREFKKLFVATVGGKRVLWLPTTRGHVLLLQPRNPKALLDRLRELRETTVTSGR